MKEEFITHFEEEKCKNCLNEICKGKNYRDTCYFLCLSKYYESIITTEREKNRQLSALLKDKNDNISL